MEKGNMTIAHNSKGGKVITLKEVPAAPKFMSETAQKYFTAMGEKLVKVDRLRDTFIETLVVWAEAAAQYEWATTEINLKNAKKSGTGYIQKFASGAQNFSPQVSLRNDAADTMIKCSKLFGLDPKSEKELKAVPDAGQMSWVEDFFNRKNAQ